MYQKSVHKIGFFQFVSDLNPKLCESSLRNQIQGVLNSKLQLRPVPLSEDEVSTIITLLCVCTFLMCF